MRQTETRTIRVNPSSDRVGRFKALFFDFFGSYIELKREASALIRSTGVPTKDTERRAVVTPFIPTSTSTFGQAVK